MGIFVKLLQFVGCINVLFLTFNNSYQFSSDYFSNSTLMKTLIVLVFLSFAKDLLNYIGKATTESKPLYYLFRFVTILIPGILSSLVILIPKLIFIESQHLDSMMIKFTVRITRLWSKEELSLYLANLVEERGISKLVSESDQSCIVERSSSMSELRNSLNMLVNERSEALKSDMPRGMTEIQTMVQEPSWFSENTVLVMTVSIIAIVALVGVGYLLYTNSGSSGNTEPTESAYDDTSLQDIEAKVASLGTLIESKEPIDIEEIVELVKNGIESDIDGIESEIIRLSTTSNAIIDNSEKIATLTHRVNEMSASVDALIVSGKVTDTQIQRLKSLLIGFRNKALEANRISQEALERTEKFASGTEGLSGQLGTSETRVSQEVARSFDSRITSLENSNSNMLESASSFVKIMVEAAKGEILNSDEFVAMRTLLSNEAFRNKLMDLEVENFVDDIVNKKD